MTLYVINPNSSVGVTSGIDMAVEPLRAWGHTIKCLTLSEGPRGIETDEHVADVANPLCQLVRSLTDATGIVIACFSDPGVQRLRSELGLPVLGIREAAVTYSLTLGTRFGVIAISEASVRRHLVAFEMMGLSGRLAGDRPLGLSVAQLSDEGITLERMLAVADDLRNDGADVLILGCAGMPQYRARVEAATALPVIEPCQVAVAMTLGRITLNLKHQEMKHA